MDKFTDSPRISCGDGSIDIKEELIAGQEYLGIKGFKANIREKSSTGY